MSFTKKANGQVNSVTEAGSLELNIPDAGATGESAPKAYESLSKEQLIALLKERDIALAARAATKKYGLVWEEKEEAADRKGVGMVPLLVADESRFVRADPGRPTHVLIEGDNYHALKVLACTHERSVDVIYIDPPYNTGLKKKGVTDFKYNDTYVDAEDGFRHSKWLSFMSQRLELASKLLKDTGVLFISINEYEVAPLKLLADSIFGEQSNILHWKTRGTGGQVKDGALVRQVEYVLVYFRNPTKGRLFPTEFSEGEENWLGFRKTGGKWQRSERPNQFYPFYVDPHTLQVSLEEAVGLIPVFPRDSAGIDGFWHNAPSTARDKLTTGRLRARVNTKGAFVIEVNNGEEGKAINSGTLVDIPSSRGTLELQELGLEFDNPKPTELIRHLLLLAGGAKSACVVDFFAGSGTTGHAVMQLNAEDGGTRQCILVTNDEGEFKASDGSVLDGGICTHVTHPRLQRVIEGYTTSAGKTVEGLNENLAFYRAEFTPDRTTHGGTKKLFEELVDTLRFKEGCFDEVPTEDGPWRLFTDNKGHHMVVLLDEFASEECAEIVARLDGTVKVYAFAYFEDDDVSDAFAHLSNVEVVLQPGRLLKALRKVHAPTQKA